MSKTNWLRLLNENMNYKRKCELYSIEITIILIHKRSIWVRKLKIIILIIIMKRSFTKKIIMKRSREHTLMLVGSSGLSQIQIEKHITWKLLTIYQRPSFKMCVPKFRVWMGTKATKGRQKTLSYFLSQRIHASRNQSSTICLNFGRHTWYFQFINT